MYSVRNKLRKLVLCLFDVFIMIMFGVEESLLKRQSIWETDYTFDSSIYFQEINGHTNRLMKER